MKPRHIWMIAVSLTTVGSLAWGATRTFPPRVLAGQLRFTHRDGTPMVVKVVAQVNPTEVGGHQSVLARSSKRVLAALANKAVTQAPVFSLQPGEIVRKRGWFVPDGNEGLGRMHLDVLVHTQPEEGFRGQQPSSTRAHAFDRELADELETALRVALRGMRDATPEEAARIMRTDLPASSSIAF
jgi:hypothetical protein